MVADVDFIVIGSTGMLGTDLVHELSVAGKHVLGLHSDQVDIRNSTAILNMPVPKVLINCAGYTNVDRAEEEPELAWAVNTKGASNLTGFCRKHRIPIIHISTDYVFGGGKQEYTEEAAPRPLNYYGKTKAEGEDWVRKWEKHYIVRTSWLFGVHGRSFVQKVLERKEPMRVVDDQHGKPTYTHDLAQAIISLLDQPYGTYHITNEGVCTWYEFAKEIAKQAELDVEIIPVSSEERHEKAERPEWSVLENTKTEKLRSWKSALNSYLEEVH